MDVENGIAATGGFGYKRKSMFSSGCRQFFVLGLIFLARLCFHIAFKFSGFLGGVARVCRAKALSASKDIRVMETAALDDSLRVVSLLCHRDVSLWQWAYASWRHFSGICAPVLILDDGSLTDADRKLLCRWPEVTIIARSEADTRVAEFYRDYPQVMQYRRDLVMAPKLLDIPVLVPAGKRVLLFDADLLFFRHPAEVVAALKQPVLDGFVYAGEEDSSYSAEPELTRRFTNLPHGFNAGFLVYERDWLTSEKLGHLCTLVREIPPMKILYEDQIIYAMLASERGHRSFPATYGTSMTHKPDSLVMKHYHSWMKDFYIQEGLWYFLRHL